MEVLALSKAGVMGSSAMWCDSLMLGAAGRLSAVQVRGCTRRHHKGTLGYV